MQRKKLFLFFGTPLVWIALFDPMLVAQHKVIRAQKLLDRIVQEHPEITELEISAAREGREPCVTIAATKPKQVGEKCDDDEATALRILEPVVEDEPEGFDVTAPLHDAHG